MQSSFYGMVEKAHRYSDDPSRVQFSELRASVRGDNDANHCVSLADGRLRCDCDHYEHESLCAHVLTIERILKSQLPANAAPFPGAA